MQIANGFESDLILEDRYIDAEGRVYQTDWKGLKERSLPLADSFDRLGMNKQAVRVRDCSIYLEFLQPISSVEGQTSAVAEGRMKLNKANFCMNRLCPACMKRRQLKIFSQVSKVMDVACSMGEYEFLFLTVTHPNCDGDKLSSVLDTMYSAYEKFRQLRSVERAVVGWYRALEVNFDPVESISSDMYSGNPARHMKPRKAYYDGLGLTVGDDNPNFTKFHPHFHTILVVRKGYFTGQDYLSQEEIAVMWSNSLGVPGEYRQVFIEKIKAAGSDRRARGIKGALSEVAKYPIKDFEIFVPSRDDLTDYAVKHLCLALNKRRMISYGGILRKIHHNLHLGDPIDGDLVHVDEEKIREDLQCIVRRFSWCVGATSGYDYRQVDAFVAAK